MTKLKRKNQMIEDLNKPIDEKAMERAIRKSELEYSLRETRKEQAIEYAKAVGKALVPVAVFGGISVLSNLFSTQFENHDLQKLINYGLPIGGGLFIGASGMVNAYIDWFIAPNIC